MRAGPSHLTIYSVIPSEAAPLDFARGRLAAQPRGQAGARRAVAYADGWMPIGGRGGDTLALLPPFREMLAAANRDPAEVPVTLFGVGMDGDALKRARDAGVDRVVFGVPPEPKDKVLPLLDKGAALMRGM